MDLFPYIFGAFGLLIGLHILIQFLQRPRTLEEAEGAALMKFVEQARADGLDVGEALSELRIRTGFVRLRREASALVMADPSDAKEAIRKTAKAIAMDLAIVRKDEARRFVKWVESCGDREILLPEAWQATVDWTASQIKGYRRDPQDIVDRIAAMRGD
jgi:hypothetical protein